MIEDLVDKVDDHRGIVAGIPIVNVNAREVRTRFADYSATAWEALTPAERREWQTLLAAIHSRRLVIEAQPVEVRARIRARAEELANQAGGDDPFRIPQWFDLAMAEVRDQVLDAV